MYKDLPYRPCAGIMMINQQLNVFVGRRINCKYDAWQMPQGGIDKGECAADGAMRELLEEIGTNNVRLIKESQSWLRYDLPENLLGKMWKGKYRGQEQKWFLVEFLGGDDEINVHTAQPEFAKWKWLNPHDLPDLIVPFKKQLYKDILEEFLPYIQRKKHD